MSWIIVKGTVLEEGIVENQARVVRTLLVETENGERIVIAPKEKILNKLSRGDVIEFETQEGKDAKLTWYLGRLKRNCRKLRIISH
jgi:hypothetical protein